MKAHDAQERKEEKDYAQREKRPNDEEYCKVQLLRDLRVRNLFLRLPEERLPLPGSQLRVWLPQARRGKVIKTGHPIASRRQDSINLMAVCLAFDRRMGRGDSGVLEPATSSADVQLSMPPRHLKHSRKD
jgi:hypothetical protein